jgi:hypothetical protein
MFFLRWKQNKVFFCTFAISGDTIDGKLNLKAIYFLAQGGGILCFSFKSKDIADTDDMS